MAKIKIVPLGTRTDLFRPAETAAESESRGDVRGRLGIQPADLLCIYTGRLSPSKNPLLLARAVERLRAAGMPFVGLFIGEGQQALEIQRCRGSRVLPFMRSIELPHYYRAADIGVWPNEESMSMLDCAACGLPVVCNDQMGDPGRILGNGMTFRNGSEAELAEVLRRLTDSGTRRELGNTGRAKMLAEYSWTRRARQRLEFYQDALKRLEASRR